MKTSNQIREALSAKNAEIEALVKLATDENRDLTADEEKSYDEMVETVERLTADLDKVEKQEEIRKAAAKKASTVVRGPEKGVDKETNEVRERFSIRKAILGTMNGKLDGAELEMHQEGTKEANRIGKSGNGFMLPSMITRANITENSTTGITVGPFEGGLHAQMVVADWATVYEGVQDYRIPVITATGTAWEGETDAAADGGSALSTLDLSPTRLATYVNVSKQALMQHNQSLENALVADIQSAVSSALDLAIFTSTAGAPTYIGNGKTPVDDANINELCMRLVEEVMGNNALKGNLGFVSSHSLYAELWTAVQVSGVSALLNMNQVGGYPIRFSSQVADPTTNDEGIYFGDWSQLVIAQFGPVEILVDPYSQALNGMNQIVLNSYYDFGLKQSAGISLGAFSGTNA